MSRRRRGAESTPGGRTRLGSSPQVAKLRADHAAQIADLEARLRKAEGDKAPPKRSDTKDAHDDDSKLPPVKKMKDIIARAGLSTTDLVEKADVIAQYKEALAIYNEPITYEEAFEALGGQAELDKVVWPP